MHLRTRFLTVLWMSLSLCAFGQLPKVERPPQSREPDRPRPAQPSRPAPKQPAVGESHQADLSQTTPSLIQSLRNRRFDTVDKPGPSERTLPGGKAGQTVRVTLPRRDDAPSTPTVESEPAAQLVRPAKTGDPANVLVGVVGNYRMTLKELQAQLAQIPRGTVAGSKAEIERRRRRDMWRILGDWLESKLFALEARARGLTTTDQEVDAYIARTAEDRGLKISVEERCRLLGVDEETFRNSVADAVLADKLIRQEIRASVTDEMIRQVVQKAPATAWTLPKRQVREIMYPFRVDEFGRVADDRSERRDKRRTMNKIRRRLRWFGGKFEDYAKSPQELEAMKEPEPVLRNLGWLTWGDSLGLFTGTDLANTERNLIYQKVFALTPSKGRQPSEYVLEVGEISEVFQSAFGYHIIQVTANQPPRMKTIEELRADAEAIFHDRVRNNLLKQLKAKHHEVLRVNPDGLLEHELPEQHRPDVARAGM